MSICYHEGSREFHLSNRDIGYIITVLKNGQLGQLYFGKKTCMTGRVLPICWSCVTAQWLYVLTKEILDGTYQAGISVLWSRGYAVSGGDSAGKRKPDHGFLCIRHMDLWREARACRTPATYTEDSQELQTLEIELKDELIHTTLILYYTIFEELPAITRSAR